MRNIALRRLWAAIAVSSLGDWLGLLATTALAQQLTRTESIGVQGAAISGVILTRLLPDLLFGPIAGALADRLDRRKTVIVGETIACLLYLSIAIVYDLKFLYIAQFVIEAVGLFTMAAKQALWVGTVPKERLALANQLSLISVYGAVPVAAGIFAVLSTVSRFFEKAGDDPALANVKFAIVVALGIDAASYAFSALTVYLTRRQLSAGAADRPEAVSILALIGEGIRFVAGNKVIRTLYVGILGAFAAGGFTVGVAQLYVNSLKAGAAGYSILFGTVFTGLAFGMIVGPKIFPAISRRRIFGTAIAAAGLFLIGMSVVGDYILAVGFAFFVGLSAGVAWIIGYTLIGYEVEDRLRGRTFAFVVSSVRIMLLVTVGLGPILAGLLKVPTFTIGGVVFSFSGPELTLLIAGVVALLIGGYAGRSMVGGRMSVREAISKLVGHSDELIENNARVGLFIVIEGPDRVITAQQAELLARSLAEEKMPVLLTREPTESGSGPRAKELFDLAAIGTLDSSGLEPETVIHLAIADRIEHVAKVIRPALDAGQIVICDQWVDSAIAFLGAADGTDTERILRMSAWGTDGLRPDLTVVLDAEVVGPLARVRAAFLARADAAGARYEVISSAVLAAEAGSLVTELASRVHISIAANLSRLNVDAAPDVPVEG